VRYRTAAGFDAALAKLPREHRRQFTEAVGAYLSPALTAGAHRGTAPWPRRLRIHRIGEVYSLTWSFSGPDGRALFTMGPDADGEPLLTWLATAYHDIDQEPSCSHWKRQLLTVFSRRSENARRAAVRHGHSIDGAYR
jgi:hypothetical protein